MAPFYAQKVRNILSEADDIKAAFQRTGTVIHACYAPAVMMRLQDESDSTDYNEITKWQTLVSYIISRWTGTCSSPVSFSEASWTGLMNRNTLEWDTKLCDLLNIDQSKLPNLADYDDALPNSFTSAFLTQCPEFALLKDCKLYLSIGDGAAANIGSLCCDESRVALTIGTSAAMRIVADASTLNKVEIPYGLWCYRVDVSSKYLSFTTVVVSITYCHMIYRR